MIPYGGRAPESSATAGNLKAPYMERIPVPHPTSRTTLSLKMWGFW